MASLARRGPGKLFPPVTLGRFSTAAPSEEVESDVIIIGGGYIGSAAAIKAGRMGLKTTCIEKRGLLGRIFPYNTLLRLCEAKHVLGLNLSIANARKEKAISCLSKVIEGLSEAKHALAFNLPTAIARKEKATACLSKGIEGLFKKNEVNYIKGIGRFVSPTEVSVDTIEGDKVVVKGKKIIIATGSRLESTYSGNIMIDEKRIVSSVGALSLTEFPKRAVVIGANIRGLEIGSVWGQFGTKVMVVDVAADIIPTMDGEIRENFQSKLVNQNLEFMLDTRVVGVDGSSSSGVEVTIEPAAGGQQRILETDLVLVPEHRVPNTKELHLEKIGITNDDVRMAGGIQVINKRFSSSVPGVYAIGDVAARKAVVDGAGYMELIITGLGEDLIDFDKVPVPAVIYTHPEVASIGRTEEQVKANGDVEYLADRFTLENGGLGKVIAEKNTDKVLGVHVVSPNAEVKIGDAALAMMHDRGVGAKVVKDLLFTHLYYSRREFLTPPASYLMDKMGSSPLDPPRSC